MRRLSEWCELHLSSPVDRVLWETGHLSTVVAAALADGREVVVKIRPWETSLEGCAAVHRHVHRAGYPCPEPLLGPVPFGQLAASAEVHMPGGSAAGGHDPDLAVRSAGAFAHLLRLMPSLRDVPPLDPPRPWAGWNHPEASPWPPPDEGVPVSSNASTEALVPLAKALNEKLRGTRLPLVAGHVDFYQGNLRWNGDGTLFAVDDWDSISALPEAALVGCAAVSFRPSSTGFGSAGFPGTEVSDTEEFLAAYASASGRSFSEQELEISWAAGLWQRTFDAAKRLAMDELESARAQLRDAGRRAERAGVARGLVAL